MKRHPAVVALTIILLFIASGYVAYRYYRLRQIFATTVAASEVSMNALQSQLAVLTGNLTAAQGDVLSLTDALHTAQNSIVDYQQQIQSLTGTVGTLQKLTQLDPELLKKYSKVYFLNEQYVPSSLTDIDAAYVNGKNRTLQIHTNVWPHLQALLDDSNAAGLGLRVQSAYRSFGTQAMLKSSYIVTYGTTAANKFSAEQGYSEHQLGTTVDLTTTKTGTLTSTFDKTPEFAWLTNNAYRYGFTLSYPKNNKYYIYEPWHWRYVGIDLATKLHDDGHYLYDLDQREIDGYLISIFD